MLSWIDWTIIITFLLLSLGIGLYYRKGAGKSLNDFFLGGRDLPWYVAGLSMVATTFAADTPLAVSEMVADGGISKNWLWWSFIFGGALTTFFFATLWRRSGVLTELEFITLRYEGKPAKYLRIVKAIYLGLVLNAIIIAWVNLAMMTLLEVFFDLTRIDAMLVTFGFMVVAVIYSALSGLKGVAITDMVQFSVAMVGCITLAVLVVSSDDVGGIDQLKAKLPSQTFNFVPSFGNNAGDLVHGFSLSIGAFLSFVAIQWWSSWYPGAEPGGGGYVAQRMMSTRSEKDSVWATLLFQVGHYCIRPWPWIIVGLCAIAIYAPEFNNPELFRKLEAHSEISVNPINSAEEFVATYPSYNDPKEFQQIEYYYQPRLGFVFAMKDYLPHGLIGLLFTAFIAAYLSTISTQVNWGASYIVNDFIIPLKLIKGNNNLVLLSRISTIFVLIAGAIVTPFVTSISGVWQFLMQCGAGLGLVLILRWYWWRVNAWSEISATIAPIIGFLICELLLNDLIGVGFVRQNGPFYFTVAFTTFIWLSITFITPPQSLESLRKFYEKVRPHGFWTESISSGKLDNSPMKWMFGGWVSMICTIIFSLFAIGSVILHEYNDGAIQIALAIISIIALRVFLKKTNIFNDNSEHK